MILAIAGEQYGRLRCCREDQASNKENCISSRGLEEQ